MNDLRRSFAARWFARGVALLGLAALTLVLVSAGSAKTGVTGKRYSYDAAAKYVYGKDWKAHLGKKANSKLSPIYIGWLNTDGGIGGRPHLTPIADQTVKMINEQLGGIDGHRVILKKCLMQSSESDGQACGQQFANDPQVKLIMQYHGPFGGTSFTQALAGAKPVINVAPNPVDINAKNVWVLSGARYIVGAVGPFMAKLKQTKVGFITGNSPQLVATYASFRDQTAGVLNVTPTYFDVTAADITPTIIAANLKQYDRIWFAPSAASLCTPVEKAFASQGITGTVPVLGNSVCLDPSIKKALGDFAQWDYLWFGPNLYAPFVKNGQVAAYIQSARDAGTIADVNAEPASGFLSATLVMFAAKLYHTVGATASQAKIEAAVPKQTGATFMGPPAEKYNCYPGFSNFGFLGFKVYHYQGKGKFKAINGGSWVEQKRQC